MQTARRHSSGLSSNSAVLLHLYPEKTKEQIEAQATEPANWSQLLPASMRGRIIGADKFLEQVNEQAEELKKLPKSKIVWRALGLARGLKNAGMSPELVSQAFALIRELSARCLGKYHFDTQIHAAWAMLNGMVAEMETGEGKTLAISLAAATAALSATPVHVLTANDYLASRDAESLQPLYQALGLSVGVVIGGMGPEERRRAYACDITYCTAKELAFDYLRDCLVFGSETSDISRHIDKLYGSRSRSKRLLLRGLHFAIVDECDSILIDEANTPLVLAGSTGKNESINMYASALKLASTFKVNIDFKQNNKDREVHLTPDGHEKIRLIAKQSNELQSGLRETEAIISTALCALHLYQKDQHYLIRDKRLQIIDENTGRVKPDHSWQRGLQQMIEIKEGCIVSGEQKVLSRISYQRLFRRYLNLSGATGTASQVASELRHVYGLGVVCITPHRPVKRRKLKEKTFLGEQQKLNAIVRRVKSIHKTGRPVLLATRTVETSEKLSRMLKRHGLVHQVLNAKQDANEASIVAKAGGLACITVATNMAGRGTDIVLSDAVLKLGGLHVIATERHEASRIDRQLFGRCARQGNPGSCELFSSIEDHLIKTFCSPWILVLASHPLLNKLGFATFLNPFLSRYAQWRAERHQAQQRRDLLNSEESIENNMGFTGPLE